MSEHDLEPLSPELRAFIDAELARPAPAFEASERAFAKIADAVRLLPPPGGGGGDGPSGGGAPSGAQGPAPTQAISARPSLLGRALLASPLGTAAGIFAVGVMSGVLATTTLRAPPTTLHLAASAPHASAPPPSASPPLPSVGSQRAPEATPRASDGAAAHVATPPPAPPPANGRAQTRTSEAESSRDASLAAERTLIETAKTAVGRRDGSAALAALDRHAAAHPRGQLAEEREALAVQALAVAGRLPEARARARRFEATYPTSILRFAVDEAVR